MEPNLYCFPLAARMTNRYFAAAHFAGFAAAHFAGTDWAVAEPEMVVAGYMVAGQTAETAIELAAVDKAAGPVDHLAADHIEVAVRVAVVGTAAWVADTHSAGTDPTAAQVADTPAEEAVNH